jgi:hypothetical protein
MKTEAIFEEIGAKTRPTLQENRINFTGKSDQFYRPTLQENQAYLRVNLAGKNIMHQLNFVKIVFL